MSSSFAQILRRLAAERPQAPALTFEGSTWTFAELQARSARTARALQASGIRPGDRVGMLSRNCAESFELMFACSQVGAILVGLNWRLARAEIAAIVDDARPALIVAGQEESALLDGVARATPGLHRVVLLGPEYEAWRAPHPADDPGHSGAPDEVALLLYTSGTTGLPKGVMLSNEGMCHTERLGQSWGMGPDSVNLVAMPMFHIGGCGYGSSTMLVGGHTVLLREVVPSRLVEAIARHRVTHTFLVPTVVQALLQVDGVQQADLSSLELLMYGAAPMGDVLLRRAMSVLRCRFIQAYGMTETSGTVVVLPPQDHDPGGARAGLLNSVGRALPWVDLRVVDPNTLGDAPAGAVGEIWVRSRMLMKGYWNKPAETQAAVMPGAWLRTGDAAYQDAQGYVYLFDRFKDMIISGGENIYPAEIENVLNGHPDVREVAVIGVAHAKWGETPRAIVVPQPGRQPDADELIAWTRERLAHYKCPTSVRFAESLPRNASGKLLKRELRRTHGEAQA